MGERRVEGERSSATDDQGSGWREGGSWKFGVNRSFITESCCWLWDDETRTEESWDVFC